ncbi:MAG: pepsin/retropepsin-like aspartic protease family protein [Actinomycetota bacterium]|nr:pepsin/retropepsin-like aspartic protease family protein [Actinomycetota bacterium]
MAARLNRVLLGVVVAGSLAGSGLLVGSTVGVFAPPAGASQRSSCSQSAVAAPVTLDLKMAKTPEGKVPTIAVCIDAKGPYRFLVSTGVGTSVIAPHLAHALHLRDGARTTVRGATCVASAPTAPVANWSMSGLKLDGQALVVSKIAWGGRSPTPQGIIGSDVLARLGAVRIGYHPARLEVLGRESAAPKGNSYVIGKAGGTPPAALTPGRIALSAPLRVFESPQGTIVAVPVKFAGHTAQLAVDTGSAASWLTPSAVKSLKLKGEGRKAGIVGVGCKGKGQTYASGAWALGRTTLGKATLASHQIAGVVNGGLQGALGANVLASRGSVIIDYSDAHLWLTSG